MVIWLLGDVWFVIWFCGWWLWLFLGSLLIGAVFDCCLIYYLVSGVVWGCLFTVCYCFGVFMIGDRIVLR